jgi:Uma2 family endonuclease
VPSASSFHHKRQGGKLKLPVLRHNLYMASVTTPKLTEEEYLRLERLASEKSEYHGGEIFAMAGGTPNHSLLAAAACALLYRQAPAGCRVFSSDLRIHIASGGAFSYADCVVVCGELQLAGDQRDNLLNPLLIVEVLSPSTENYDRGKKFELYRTIESFREYLIVHQERRCVEHYSRQDDPSWILREYHRHGSSVTIARLGVELSLDELYASAIDCN